MRVTLTFDIKHLRRRVARWLYPEIDDMIEKMVKLSVDNAYLRASNRTMSDLTDSEYQIIANHPSCSRVSFRRECRRCHDVVTDERQWNEEKGGCMGCFFRLDRATSAPG